MIMNKKNQPPSENTIQRLHAMKQKSLSLSADLNEARTAFEKARENMMAIDAKWMTAHKNYTEAVKAVFEIA